MEKQIQIDVLYRKVQNLRKEVELMTRKEIPVSQENKFQVGDVVRLRSDSPHMTVVQVPRIGDLDKYYTCEWLLPHIHDFGSHRFPEDAIELIKAKDDRSNAVFLRGA